MKTKCFLAILLFTFVATSVSYGEEPNTLPHKKIQVSATKNCGDTDSGWKKGVRVSLQAGKWAVASAGGAWSCWGDDSWKPPSQKGAWTWNVYIKLPSDSQSVCYGMCSNWWQFKTKQDAEKYSLSKELEPYTFELDSAGEVTFWLWDSDVSDNRGKVILEIYPLP